MKIGKGVYIIPNLLTTFNFGFGFYAIISIINGDFYRSGWAIIIAILFDGLDGKVARMTHSTSDFGLEYDSLCDLISFGLAPGLLVYSWVLQPYGRIGWLAAFLFVACGALRLARFNTQSPEIRNTSFTGLPIPAAAGFIASLVIMTRDFLYVERLHPMILALTVYILAFLMVSNIKYYSFKNLKLSRKKPFNLLIFSILSFYIIATLPELILFIILFTYVLSGPTEWLLTNKRNPIKFFLNLMNKDIKKRV